MKSWRSLKGSGRTWRFDCNNNNNNNNNNDNNNNNNNNNNDNNNNNNKIIWKPVGLPIGVE